MKKGISYRGTVFFVVSLGILMIWVCALYAQLSPDYWLESDVISGGGGQGSSNNYDLSHIMGQPSGIGVLSSPHYISYAGFFSGGALSPINLWEGTLGTKITITGSNFGTKKGKVLVGTIALTVLQWNNGFIQALITKPIDPGTYDVTIQPSGLKGIPATVERNAFTVRPAEIDSIDQGSGSAYDQVTVRGKFFGTKKGKVYLEYEQGGQVVRKSCSVTKWWMDPVTNESEIIFAVPKMVPEVCDVVVDVPSPLSDAEEKDGFTVKAPEINSVQPGLASVGEQITISGNYFGSKKPSVYLSYLSKGKPTRKICSVLRWGDDEIVFAVPKVPAGSYDLIVTNGVSSGALTGGFTIK